MTGAPPVTVAATGAPAPSRPARSSAGAPAGAAPAPEAAAPADAVSLSPAPKASLRPLFQEASRLGLLAAGASLGGPVGQALSQAAKDDLEALLHELDQAGLEFRIVHNPEDGRLPSGWKASPDRLRDKILESNGDWACGHRPSPSFTEYRMDEVVVKGPGVEMARVTGFHDLQALEALEVMGNPSSVARPDLADTLMHLEEAGVEFRLTASERGGAGEKRPPHLVGAYGAYRALNVVPTMAPDESTMLRVGLPGQELLPVKTAEDLEALRFFVLGEEVPGFSDHEQARALRRLEQGGYTFHRTYGSGEEPMSAAAVFEQLSKGYDPMLALGVRGAGREPVQPEQIADPMVGSDHLRDLSSYWVGRIAPRVGSGALDRTEADRWMQAVARPLGGLAAADRGGMMDRLHALETSLGTEKGQAVETAARALEALGDGFRPGDGAGEALGEFEALRRAIPVAQVAIDALRTVQGDLRSRSFGPEDRQAQTDRLVAAARLAPTFEEAAQALELVETTLPFDQGSGLLERLADLHRGLESPGSPLREAMEDYKLVLRHRAPEESLDEGLNTLANLYKPLVPHEGLAAAREAFVFVERGWPRGAFPLPSKAEAVNRFLSTWLLTQDLDAAREAVLHPVGAGPSPIQAEDDQVRVGTVSIPRRHP